MRILKSFFLAIILLISVSCSSKKQPEPSLAGNWKITSAVGNNDRHWTGNFTLTQDGIGYKGTFKWDSVDGQQSGTDSITGTYNSDTHVLTMKSVVISGNIESVTYTMNITDNGTKMNGVWTGSSDGSVEDPGKWTAEKQ